MSSNATGQYLDTTQVGRHPPAYRLPGTTHIGRARLGVSNLERAVEFYSETIGLAVLEAATAETRLARLGPHGENRVLLELQELPGVQPIGKRTRLGLYHTAFLLPGREVLSSFVHHLLKHNVPFGSADHEVSEALYLTDPDGLTVEVYSDRPRSSWRVREREILGGIEPLRFNELPVVPGDSWQGAPPGTTVGHLHFYADDLRKAGAFYHAGLGLDQSMWPLPTALFLAAGGYHHHVGLNVWAAGSPLASAKDARLLFWELVLPNAGEIERVAASMTSAGYVETTAAGARAFVDAWEIKVVLVAA